MKRCSVVLVGLVAYGCANEYRTAATPRPDTQEAPHVARTVYVWDCGQQAAVDLHDNGSLYLKGTDIPFRYGENCS